MKKLILSLALFTISQFNATACLESCVWYKVTLYMQSGESHTGWFEASSEYASWSQFEEATGANAYCNSDSILPLIHAMRNERFFLAAGDSIAWNRFTLYKEIHLPKYFRGNQEFTVGQMAAVAKEDVIELPLDEVASAAFHEAIGSPRDHHNSELLITDAALIQQMDRVGYYGTHFIPFMPGTSEGWLMLNYNQELEGIDLANLAAPFLSQLYWAGTNDQETMASLDTEPVVARTERNMAEYDAQVAKIKAHFANVGIALVYVWAGE